MNKNGGYTWLQTCATVVCSSKNADEQNIICVNYVVSNRENENLILDCIQLENGLDNIKNEEIISDNGAGSPGSDPSNDGPSGASGRPGDLQKSPKSETPEPKSRTRNLSSGTSSVVNNGTNNVALTIDTPNNITIPDENIISASAISNTSNRKPHKRKLKQIDTEEMTGAECPSKMVASALSLSQELTVQAPRLPGTDEHAESSVKELENAMSKHLPSPVNNNNINNNNNTTTDFSTDALLKQQQEKSSTIQWIGAHHHNPFHQQTATMPATALLRQLYANRESVIRATARQSSGGVFYSGNYFFFFIRLPYKILMFAVLDGAQNGPLPTPPGSESSFDNQFLLHNHAQKSGDAFTNLVSTYGGYPSSMDYHNAMTPPSSVSPREPSSSGNNNNKSIHPTSNGYDFSDSLRSQYSSGGVPATSDAPTLPLKPQPYSAAAAMHHAANSIEAYGSIDQSQYFSHHSGFHLYHKGAPTSGWYTTPS